MSDKYYIPKHLNDPPRWLFWTIDEALSLIAGFLFGVLSGQILTGLFIGIMFMLLIKKFKTKNGGLFLIHIAYWYLPFTQHSFKATPPSYIREYIG